MPRDVKSRGHLIHVLETRIRVIADLLKAFSEVAQDHIFTLRRML